MRSYIVWGIDISTNTGLYIVRYQGGVVTRLKCLTITHPPHERPIDRARKFGSDIIPYLTELPPDLIMVEGYAMGAKGMSTAIIEVSALIKFTLAAKGYDWIEIPPSNLKMFVYNKGNGAKSLMLKEVFKRFDIDVTDDNQADAGALCMMGCNLLGMDNVPETHLRAWDKIRPHADYVRVLETLL